VTDWAPPPAGWCSTAGGRVLQATRLPISWLRGSPRSRGAWSQAELSGRFPGEVERTRSSPSSRNSTIFHAPISGSGPRPRGGPLALGRSPMVNSGASLKKALRRRPRASCSPNTVPGRIARSCHIFLREPRPDPVSGAAGSGQEGSRQGRMNASTSALIVSASVIAMPCEKPG